MLILRRLIQLLCVSSSLVLSSLAQVTVRASTPTSGGDGNAASTLPAISADGQVILLQSLASNLIPGDTNDVSDVFVFDSQTGLLTRMTEMFGLPEGNGPSCFGTVAPNGSWMACESAATNFVQDNNNSTDVFIFDVATMAVQRLSLSSSGMEANGGSWFPSLSNVGKAALASDATNLVLVDPNGFRDVFVRDWVLGTTIIVSVDSMGFPSDGESSFPVISGDGKYVAFSSRATNLVSNDTNGVQDIFLRDLVAGTTVRVSQTPAGVGGNRDSWFPWISDDGSVVVFSSLASNLVLVDTNRTMDVFIYTRSTGQMVLASLTNNGSQGNDYSAWAELSADGRYLLFESAASNMVVGDNNGVSDVFLRDLILGTTKRVSVHAGGAEGNYLSQNAGMSADASVIVFQSDASNLITFDELVTSEGFPIADIFLASCPLPD